MRAWLLGLILVAAAACGEADRPAAVEFRPPVPPFMGPHVEPTVPVPPPPPEPREVLSDRLERMTPAGPPEAAWAVLGRLGSGSWAFGEGRAEFRRLVQFAGQGRFDDPLVAFALWEARTVVDSPLLVAFANRYEVALPPGAPPGIGGLAALCIHRRAGGRSEEEKREAARTVRAWVDRGWAAAVEEGGISLAARTLARLLLGDSPREDSRLRDALDRLIEEGPPVAGGRVTDPVHLLLLDRAFWRVFWWIRGDRERGERWRKIRLAATLPVPADATLPEVAAVLCGLNDDAIICVYSGFLGTLERGWR